MQRFLFLVVFLFSSPIIYAQSEKVVIEQEQFWISINNVYRFSEKWGALSDFHIRRTNFMADPNFYFLRFGARYWILPKITLSGGYAHMWLATSQSEVENFAHENRLYQEILFKNNIGRTRNLFRIRAEQRWRETLNENLYPSGLYSYSNRFRVLFSMSIPFTKSDWPWNIMVADEILINFGEDIVYNTFDQNRLTLGVKKRINKNWSFDMGYMMVFQQLPTGNVYNLNHTFRLFFYGIFDFRKNVDPDAILMEDHAEE